MFCKRLNHLKMFQMFTGVSRVVVIYLQNYCLFWHFHKISYADSLSLAVTGITFGKPIAISMSL